MPDQVTPPTDFRNVPFVVTPKQMHKFVGLTALGLPIILLILGVFARPICFMTSISHFYYTPVGGDILVGALSIIGAIMLFFYAYKGDDSDRNSAYNRRNARLAKLAGLFALGVAFVPTSGLGCYYDGEASRFLIENTQYTVPDGAPRSIYVDGVTVDGGLSSNLWALLGLGGFLWGALGLVHYLSAAGMFAILGYFSFFVFTRVQTDDALAGTDTLTEVKELRNRIYRVAGGLIFFAIATLVVKVGLESFFLKDAALLAFRDWWNGLYLTFIFEALGLAAFGVSWLVKARIFGWFEDT